MESSSISNPGIKVSMWMCGANVGKSRNSRKIDGPPTRYNCRSCQLCEFTDGFCMWEQVIF